MRIKIWHKLFLAILLVVMAVLALNLLLSSFSFERGFSRFIEERRLEKLDGLRERLVEHYRKYGGWAALQNDSERWVQLLEAADLNLPRAGKRGLGQRPRGRYPTEFLGLLDRDQVPIIGSPPGMRDQLLSIEQDAQVIGYLKIMVRKPMRSRLERRFSRQLKQNLLLTAVLSLVIAAIAALLLARLFNRPIAQLAEMARELTAGRFESRVSLNRRDEFGALAADLNTLAQTLEQNRQARRQWIADISHELRTPLTVLRGELEAMEDGVRPLNRDSIRSLSLEVKQLKRLVDDLFQLSLSDQGALDYQKEPVDVVALLRQVVAGFEHSVHNRQLQLESRCEQEVVLWVDPQRLTQLVTNLLENSQRYTDAGGEIRIWCEQDAHHWRLHLEDTPPGVPAQQIGRLFERLYRAEGSRNRRQGGSGLGLSIARAIAEAHGGTLSAQASVLGGLWITLQLPREK